MRPFRVVHNNTADIQTGDLVFSTTGTFVSNLIKVVTMSRWTHVSIAMWIVPYASPTNEPVLALFESANSRIDRDLITNKHEKGTKLILFGEAIASYRSMAIRKIRKKLDTAKVEDFLYKNHGQPFISDIFAWYKAYVMMGIFEEEGVCCSQLVAQFIMQVTLDRLPEEDGVRPIHFSPGKIYKGKFPSYLCASAQKGDNERTAVILAVLAAFTILLFSIQEVLRRR